MSNRNSGLAGRWLSRGLVAAVVTCMTLWSTMAMATITQGDFSVFGNLTSRWSGRWGEGSTVNDGTPTVFPLTATSVPGTAGTRTGGSFDFNHWDLVQARQVGDIRPDYHLVKNYNLLGRLDTLVLKDADAFAVFRPWYDALPDLKHRGIAQLDRDWPNYTDKERIGSFVRDDLREYYADLNFTDNFSMRVGKQQIIWSEADALSGTEVTNPTDLRYHWTHFEAPEDLRENLRMVKFNYILPDFLKTANNTLDFFVIPGDWEHTALITDNMDARNPYVVQSTAGTGVLHQGFNDFGQPFRNQTLADQDPTPLQFSPGSPVLGTPGTFFDLQATILQRSLKNSLDNSEFGVRYSTLLPIGNGLQTSFIYLYEARSPKLSYCVNCSIPTGFLSLAQVNHILTSVLNQSPVSAPPGTFFSIPALAAFGAPLGPTQVFKVPRGSPAPVTGVVSAFLRNEIVRENFLGITGTYYDKDLTDIVYRYDFLYTPKMGVNVYNGGVKTPKGVVFTADPGARWTQETRWIVAGDRPTYIPWISKQHTFLTFQNTLTWLPDRPDNAVEPSAPTNPGKAREISDLTFVSALDWLINGQLTTLNVATWDWDDNVGFVESENTYRYSRNVLFGVNGIWYLGRSGRYTDPYIFSRDQRINEFEVRFTYEI